MSEPWTIRRVLDWTARDLDRRGVSSARLDAEVLLAHALASDRLALYLDLDRPLEQAERAAFRQLVERRRGREPVALITRRREFWSLDLEVGPGVLVPRPETEVLVEECLEAIAALAGSSPPRVVDVGTGSGCIALAVATERSEARVLAVDVAREAAAVAERNARRLGLASRVATVVGDLLEPVTGPVDLVVSNPPYIPTAAIDGLEPEVSRWEPRLALDGGADGLSLLRRLAAAAASVLREGGVLAVEVGDDDQAEAVGRLLPPALHPWRLRRDYSGTGRVVVAHRR